MRASLAASGKPAALELYVMLEREPGANEYEAGLGLGVTESMRASPGRLVEQASWRRWSCT